MGGKLEADDYRDPDGFYSLEIEWKVKWYSLSDEQQKIHLGYLKGLHFLMTDPKSISCAQLRWLIKYSDIDISIIPLHYHRKFSLCSELPEAEGAA